jgi:hypothetical protein
MVRAKKSDAGKKHQPTAPVNDESGPTVCHSPSDQEIPTPASESS